MTARNPLPSTLGHHFTLASADDAGVTRSRLRAQDVAHPFRGVNSRAVRSGDPTTWHDTMKTTMAAFAQRMTDGEFFVHAAALLVFEVAVPVALRASTRLPVGVLHPMRGRKGRDVVGVQIRPHLATIVRRRGMTTTDPATTWASLAARLAHRDLVSVGDALVRTDRMPGSGRILSPPLATVDDLRTAIACGRRPGVERLRRAIEAVREGASSPPETHLRLALVDAGLPEPDLDVDIRDVGGALLGCSELVYPRYRVAVEYEGDHHRTERLQWNRDIEKYESYVEAGWAPVRITAAHLYPDPAAAVSVVGRALVRAGWRP